MQPLCVTLHSQRAESTFQRAESTFQRAESTFQRAESTFERAESTFQRAEFAQGLPPKCKNCTLEEIAVLS